MAKTGEGWRLVLFRKEEKNYEESAEPRLSASF